MLKNEGKEFSFTAPLSRLLFTRARSRGRRPRERTDDGGDACVVADGRTDTYSLQDGRGRRTSSDRTLNEEEFGRRGRDIIP